MLGKAISIPVQCPKAVYCTQRLLSAESLTFWDEICLCYFKDSIPPSKSHLILNYALQYCDLHTAVAPSTAVSLIIPPGSHLAFSLFTSSNSCYGPSCLVASETRYLLGILLSTVMCGPGGRLDSTCQSVDSSAVVFKC